MTEMVLLKDKLNGWVAKLSAFEVHAPAFEDNVWNFKKSEGEIRLDHPYTVHSQKSIVFPQREVFFSFEQAKKSEPPVVTECLPNGPTRVVFGVRPCDAKGNTLNDKVFSGEFDDPYYWARRKNTVTVALACNFPPNKDCFCQSVGGSPCGEEGADILMTELSDAYHVKVLTEEGKALVDAAGDLFAKATDAHAKERDQVHQAALAEPQRQVEGWEAGDMAQRMEAMRDSDLWALDSQACISCGICTFLCPTCHCFDMNDEIACVSPCKGKKVRSWDSCQFPDFTMHTTGHNPRNDKASRMRQRISHKFQYFVSNYGTTQCVGCGRCTSECPVGIDLISFLNKVPSLNEGSS